MGNKSQKRSKHESNTDASSPIANLPTPSTNLHSPTDNLSSPKGEIVQKYSYTYNWQDQYEVWRKIGYYYASEVVIKKIVGSTEIQIVFDNFSTMRIWAKCNDYLKSAFIDNFNIENPSYDGDWLLIKEDKYNIQNCFTYLEKEYLKKIEDILDL